MLKVSFKFLDSKKVLKAGLHTALTSKLRNSNVIPDVITQSPKEMLKVCYGGGVKIKPGDQVTPTQARFPPCIFWNANKNAFHTLCLVDPDAPSRKQPKFREWQHWLVGNIPGDHLVRGEVLSEYVGPGPPQGTGFHRYVILIYKQMKEIQFSEPRLTNRSSEHRGLFSTVKFAEKYTLEGPVAGNFFIAKYDAYVDKLYKQLSGR